MADRRTREQEEAERRRIRAEEAAKALNLSPEETLSAALGSLASDSFKKNGLYEVLTHNRAAEAMLARTLPSQASSRAWASPTVMPQQ